MIQNYFDCVKRILGSSISQSAEGGQRGRETTALLRRQAAASRWAGSAPLRAQIVAQKSSSGVQ